MSNIEQTLSIIKPDAVERNLDNEIKEIFKNTQRKIENHSKPIQNETDHPKQNTYKKQPAKSHLFPLVAFGTDFHSDF